MTRRRYHFSFSTDFGHKMSGTSTTLVLAHSDWQFLFCQYKTNSAIYALIRTTLHMQSIRQVQWIFFYLGLDHAIIRCVQGEQILMDKPWHRTVVFKTDKIKFLKKSPNVKIFMTLKTKPNDCESWWSKTASGKRDLHEQGIMFYGKLFLYSKPPPPLIQNRMNW